MTNQNVIDRFDAAVAKHHDLVAKLIETVKGQAATIATLEAEIANAGGAEIEKTATYLEGVNAAAEDALAAITPHAQASASDIGHAAVAAAVAGQAL